MASSIFIITHKHLSTLNLREFGKLFKHYRIYYINKRENMHETIRMSMELFTYYIND